jgi:hypothetical protein
MIEIRMGDLTYRTAIRSGRLKLWEPEIDVEADVDFLPVLIEDVKEGDWGIGGRALTAADVHAMQRGKAA